MTAESRRRVPGTWLRRPRTPAGGAARAVAPDLGPEHGTHRPPAAPRRRHRRSGRPDDRLHHPLALPRPRDGRRGDRPDRRRAPARPAAARHPRRGLPGRHASWRRPPGGAVAGASRWWTRAAVRRRSSGARGPGRRTRSCRGRGRAAGCSSAAAAGAYSPTAPGAPRAVRLPLRLPPDAPVFAAG